jgi:hypothetical protein
MKGEGDPLRLRGAARGERGSTPIWRNGAPGVSGHHEYGFCHNHFSYTFTHELITLSDMVNAISFMLCYVALIQFLAR